MYPKFNSLSIYDNSDMEAIMAYYLVQKKNKILPFEAM